MSSLARVGLATLGLTLAAIALPMAAHATDTPTTPTTPETSLSIGPVAPEGPGLRAPIATDPVAPETSGLRAPEHPVSAQSPQATTAAQVAPTTQPARASRASTTPAQTAGAVATIQRPVAAARRVATASPTATVATTSGRSMTFMTAPGENPDAPLLWSVLPWLVAASVLYAGLLAGRRAVLRHLTQPLPEPRLSSPSEHTRQ